MAKTTKRGEGVTRREFVASAVAASAVAGASAGGASAAQRGRPNVLFIFADDLGWGDLSCYGRPDYRTPNIDRLALQGTKLTDAYSASAVCTPTRCGYITGRYTARFRIGLEETLNYTNHNVGLEHHPQSIAS